MDFELHTWVQGTLEENCYFLRSQGAAQGVLVDPGSDPEGLKARLDACGAVPALIVATHGHFDHIGAVDALARAYGCPFAMAQADAPLLEVLEDSFSFYGLGSTVKPKVDFWLRSGPLQAAGLTLEVLPTPGHTPGGVCFWHAPSRRVFTGDTLFVASVGRTDFEGSSHAQLLDSIRSRLFTLPEPDRITLHPGHGESGSLGQEMRHNPFVR